MSEAIEPTPEQAIRASIEGKLCPILTMASLGQKQESRVISPDGRAPQEPSAVNCQGQNCMWFTPVADEKGIVRSGNCVIAILPTALTQNNIAIAGAFQHLVSNFKIKIAPKAH